MTAFPQRIQLSRAFGFKLQAVSVALNGLPAVKVDRSTKWGNPCRVGPNGEDAMHAAARFRALCHSGEILDLAPHGAAWAALDMEAWLAPLRGRNLACWCPLPAPGDRDHCHAAVLLELANHD